MDQKKETAASPKSEEEEEPKEEVDTEGETFREMISRSVTLFGLLLALLVMLFGLAEQTMALWRFMIE